VVPLPISLVPNSVPYYALTGVTEQPFSLKKNLNIKISFLAWAERLEMGEGG
jgi:hypothetical protein